MYLDLNEKYWWYGLKRDVAEYVALCDAIEGASYSNDNVNVAIAHVKGPNMARGGG